MSMPMTYKLDQIDRHILTELLQNGRARYVEMSKSMGVGSSTVRWRIKRLEEDGVIFGYTCLPNIEYFKLHPAIFFIRIIHDMEKVVGRLKKFGKLTSIVVTFGDSNIVCRGAFENIDDLLGSNRQAWHFPGILTFAANHRPCDFVPTFTERGTGRTHLL